MLQDTAAVNAWALWGVAYRDVIIVDDTGAAAGVYNLTEHDLQDPANLETLRGMLEEAR